MIESLQNDKIKNLVRLSTDNRFRKKSNLFLVEGAQENERAQQFNYEVVEFYICEKLYHSALPNGKIHFVTEQIYQKIAYRSTTEGIIGIYTPKTHSLTEFVPQKDSSVIVLESVEKPGNLGAIMRSCEAFGIDALIIADPKTDFYNPNVIRSSVGCIFGLPLYQANHQDLADFLELHQFALYTTFMNENAQALSSTPLQGKSAVLFGTENSGLTDFWLGKGINCQIPMAGTIDSLNLSNAVAITCYEILRQKRA